MKSKRRKENEETVIKPYRRRVKVKKEADWERIWELIRVARSMKGKRGEMAEFISQDRYKHGAKQAFDSAQAKGL